MRFALVLGLLLLPLTASAGTFRGERELLDLRRSMWVEGEVTGGRAGYGLVFGQLAAGGHLRLLDFLAARLELTGTRVDEDNGVDRWILEHAWSGLEAFHGFRLGEASRLRLGLAAELGTPVKTWADEDPEWYSPPDEWANRLAVAARLELERSWFQLQLVDESEGKTPALTPAWPSDPTSRAILAAAFDVDDQRSLALDVTFTPENNDVFFGLTYVGLVVATPQLPYLVSVRLTTGEDFFSLGVAVRYAP